jgi:SAM-dependent methyltransferase
LPLTILNLGCGTRTSVAAVNIDWSPYLRVHQSRLGRKLAPLVLRGTRLEAFRALDSEIVVHDLRKGIPVNSESVDAVYHSHVLEHIDGKDVSAFFAEVHRVLRPGGVHRVVVPDLEAHVQMYLASLDEVRTDHDEAIYGLIGQSVRREAGGTSQQRPLRRRIENLVLGDARKRGETHQWAWDHLNLRQALERAGFRDFRTLSATDSQIPDWAMIGLDVNCDGTPYKSDSLWAEAIKPS